MKRFMLVLAVLAMCLASTGTAVAGKRATIRFDQLPLGILEPGPHIIGKFVVQRIGFGDTVEVVDLGDGHRGLADSDPSNGTGAGVSILPVSPRSSLRVWSFTARNDLQWVKIMGQWSHPYEFFYPTASPHETLIPTFAGEDVAFLNLVIYGRSEDHVIVSVEAETSKAVDPGGTAWTTAGRNRMKVRGFRKDNWLTNGEIDFLVSGDWRVEERDESGASLTHAGAFSRESTRKFLLMSDGAAQSEFEALCARRFEARTGEKGTFSVTRAIGKARFNPSRTKVSFKFEIRGVVTGSFGTRDFSLKIRSRGAPVR